MPRPASEPIAIIGMACRFPGADDLEAFWRLLESGTNAVTEGVLGSGVGRVGQLFPDDAVNAACRFAGFLDRLDEFDASFFRISPVEAQRLDPQQRMMLETSWQASRMPGSTRTGSRAAAPEYTPGSATTTTGRWCSRPPSRPSRPQASTR